MVNRMCKTEDEVKQIIETLQNEYPTLDSDLIKRAIESCCVGNNNMMDNKTFLECVKERVKELRIIS
jgi:hypothetical protein